MTMELKKFLLSLRNVFDRNPTNRVLFCCDRGLDASTPQESRLPISLIDVTCFSRVVNNLRSAGFITMFSFTVNERYSY